MKRHEAKCKIKFKKKKHRQKPTYYNFNCLFSTSPLVCITIFSDDYYPSGYYRRTATI